MSHFYVECPQCHHGHDVAEAHFVHTSSRLLKCAQCVHVWRFYKQGASQNDTSPLPSSRPQMRPTNPSVTQPSQTPRPTPASTHDLPLAPRLPRSITYKKVIHHYGLEWWLLGIAIFVAIFILFREAGEIPNLHWFYIRASEKLERMKQNFSPSRDITLLPDRASLHVLTSHITEEKNEAFLNVKYEIANESKQKVTVPPVHVLLLDQDQDGHTMVRTEWTHTLSDVDAIQPGERRIVETSGPCLNKNLPTTVKISFKD